MSEKHPLISVITVVYQAVQTIEQTIQSVLEQDPIYEYIIIDGGSTDGTVHIIETYQDAVDYWISEKDNGIYDAMNKGITQANGEWIYFLGADDQLTPGIFASIHRNLLKTPAMLLYGDVKYDYGKYFRSKFSLKTYLHNTIHHQSAFYKRSLFHNFFYDTSFKIIADYDLNLSIYLRGLPHERVGVLIATCSGGGSSYDVDLSMFETNQVRGKHVNPVTNMVLRHVLAVKYFISYVLLRKI